MDKNLKKIKILVIDAFTNGHEAAKVFIKRQGWLENDCEIIFCGNHQNIFESLIKEPSYAVVPIKNSTIEAGEITEVTSRINELRDNGCLLEEKDQIDLPVEHCLLAHKNINSPEELENVMSHPKAILQCGIYLNSIGMTSDKIIKCSSTAEAAKNIAGLRLGAKIGAISHEAAADGYGLKILAKGIQDNPDNKTTFILLKTKLA